MDEIKRLCIDNVGALPQVAATRDESCITEYKLMTNHGEADYIEFGRQFNSPLFEFTMKNFMVKRREYCYAGDWGFKLNLNTGDMTPCCSNGDIKFNLFSDIEKSIPFNAIGRNCPNLFCINSSHFMSLGIIPSIECPTYAELRNREVANWYSPEMKKFLDSKLYESN